MGEEDLSDRNLKRVKEESYHNNHTWDLYSNHKMDLHGTPNQFEDLKFNLNQV